jgi:hypothetical protein
MTSTMNRRTAMLGAGATSVALAIPAAQAAHASEDIATKVDRLTHELSEALADYCGGQFRAIVQPVNSAWPVLLKNQRIAHQDDKLIGFLKNGTPKDLAEYHSLRLGGALSKQHGGCWVGTRFEGGAFKDTQIVTFVKHPGATSSFVQVVG